MRGRRATRQVRAGSLAIGGNAPVSIQSMTNVPVERVDETIAQIRRLADRGCQLVRLALRSAESASCLKKIVPAVTVPLCADVHFDHRIALAALEAGVHKVRINPGNIGSAQGVREVVAAARDRGAPIRIGVNAGSVDRRRFPEVTPASLVESAMEHVRILEDNNFSDIVVSVKSSDIPQTISANEIFAAGNDYPLHIGLTEAGYGLACAVQSSVAIGHLLLGGIGDTVRVSMTGDPVEEIPVARMILESAGERKARIRIVSCPTCGRTDPDLDILALAREVDGAVTARFGKILEERDGSLHVAVMGCEVNGPGEAKDADAGLAGIRGGKMLLFACGEKVKVVEADDAVAELVREIGNIIG
jgi:(E)-4-hydroxy-3-methylbut-2-enyl-diphosphate synthase